MSARTRSTPAGVCWKLPAVCRVFVPGTEIVISPALVRVPAIDNPPSEHAVVGHDAGAAGADREPDGPASRH